MKVYLVRHAETEMNNKGLVQGRTDTHISEKGVKEALKLKEKIKDKKIDICYVSPLIRTFETALQDIQSIPRGKESFIKDLPDDKNILIVSHSAIIRALHHILHKTDLEHEELFFPVKNCYFEEIEVNKKDLQL